MSCSEQNARSFRVQASRDALTLTLLLLAAMKITKFFMLYDFSPASDALLECSATEGQTQTHAQVPVSLAHSELSGSFSWSICPVNLWNCTATGTGPFINWKYWHY